MLPHCENMKTELHVVASREILETILEEARHLYPKESILLLKGRKSKNAVTIEDLIVPPLATYGQGFANMRLHLLPMDFSIIGTVHSHPSGHLKPSPTDLNHFFGKILMITAFPFLHESNIAVYGRDGQTLMLKIQ